MKPKKLIPETPPKARPFSLSKHIPLPTPSRLNPNLPSAEGALSWLQFLAKNVHPGALHLLLGYYHRLGWVPKGAYGWLRDLAQGIARQVRNANWDSLRVDPDRLVAIHAQSYRALLGLFDASPELQAKASTNGHALAHPIVSLRPKNHK